MNQVRCKYRIIKKKYFCHLDFESEDELGTTHTLWYEDMVWEKETDIPVTAEYFGTIKVFTQQRWLKYVFELQVCTTEIEKWEHVAFLQTEEFH